MARKPTRREAVPWKRRNLVESRSSRGPPAPGAPVHRWIPVHLRFLKIFLRQFVSQTKLLVSLILGGTAPVGLIVRSVRKNIIALPVLLDQCHFVRRKGFEFLLLSVSAGDDDLESGGDQKIFFVLHLSLRAGAAHGHY